MLCPWPSDERAGGYPAKVIAHVIAGNKQPQNQ